MTCLLSHSPTPPFLSLISPLFWQNITYSINTKSAAETLCLEGIRTKIIPRHILLHGNTTLNDFHIPALSQPLSQTPITTHIPAMHYHVGGFHTLGSGSSSTEQIKFAHHLFFFLFAFRRVIVESVTFSFHTNT